MKYARYTVGLVLGKNKRKEERTLKTRQSRKACVCLYSRPKW